MTEAMAATRMRLGTEERGSLRTMVPLFGFACLRDHVEKVLGRILLLQERGGQGLLLERFAREGSGGGQLIGNGKRKHLRKKVLLKEFQLFIGLQRR